MQKKQTFQWTHLYKKPVFWLGWLAALLYSSWPLGYILNPAVGHHQLASELEAPHQPYSWVFISMDVLTTVVIIVIGALQIRRTRTYLLLLAIISYMAFGTLVAVAALSPLNCDPSLNRCGPLMRDPKLVVHGGSSILSVIFLLISVAMLSKMVYDRQLSRSMRWIFGCILVCWATFGIGSLVEMGLKIHNNVLQYFFISVCSLSIVLVVIAIERLKFHEVELPAEIPQQSRVVIQD